MINVKHFTQSYPFYILSSIFKKYLLKQKSNKILVIKISIYNSYLLVIKTYILKLTATTNMYLNKYVIKFSK